MSEVLDQARQQVLLNGEGLAYDQLITVHNTADEQLDALLALAHEVRLAWAGDEVEVEGIVSIKTGGGPGECHFFSPAGGGGSPPPSGLRPISRRGAAGQEKAPPPA